MAFHVFDAQLRERDPIGTLLLRATVVATAIFLLVGACSAYRAWVQVYSVGLVTTDTIAPGSTIAVEVVGSGRTFVTVQLLLEQGLRTEPLRSMELPHNGDPVTDPRPQRGRLVLGLRPENLAVFVDGPARLDAIAVGRPQWLRTPPPTIVTRPVILRRAATGARVRVPANQRGS
jgi:hypothetical protein